MPNSREIESISAQTPEHGYQEMHARVATFTDKLGTPIDPGIFETVVALNLLGLHTLQSCEGHYNVLSIVRSLAPSGVPTPVHASHPGPAE